MKKIVIFVLIGLALYWVFNNTDFEDLFFSFVDWITNLNNIFKG